MQFISIYDKEIRFLLCVIDIFRKYAWAVHLEDEKGITVTDALKKILDQSRHCIAKPKGLTLNKILVDKGSEFYNREMKSQIQNNNMEMYSTHNEGKFDVAERFIRILKIQIYKYMTSVSKHVYIDKLDDIVNEYNNTQHKTTDVKKITYIDFGVENDDKDRKLEADDNVRISK